MGKGPFSFKRSSSSVRRRPKKLIGTPPSHFPSPPQPIRSPPPSNSVNVNNTNTNNNSLSAVVAGDVGGGVKGKKKAGGARLWMRFDRFGVSELVECDKNAIIRRAAIPARDLRILGPVFSQSSSILAREKAMVVNLEFIKAIVTAEEVLLLDPLRQEVIPFADQLRQQLPQKSQSRIQEASPLGEEDNGMDVSTGRQRLPVPEAVEGLQCDLPFEFQVLEVALEVVCTYLDSSVADLEREAYPVLDELARNVSTKNLELVRILKSNLTRLLARVQKLREYIDDTEDYVNIRLDNQRNELIQFQLTLSIASFAISVETAIAGVFGFNIHCTIFDVNGIFVRFVAGLVAFALAIFFLIYGYARWKKLLGT
ncbi:magnesium transporter MRS2-4-like isoform X1 [Malus domestica]|uniref:magnesium transporter MRS2-4-like isoform X1 n=1 Tax=Malus domestica TaxID=3750 RepID=UPI003976B07D